MSTIDRFDLPPPGRSDDFQKFVRDLFAEDCGDPYAQEHGRSGHSQNGTDIVAYRWKDKAWVGIQCKQRSIHSKSGITVGELQNEVSQAKALDPPLTHFILATTSRRDPKLQQEARRITTKNAKSGSFTVNVVSWDDLVDMLRRYPSVAELWYPAFKSKRRNTLNSQSKPRLIPASLQRTLGMIATCPFTQRIEWLSKLNAEIDWSGDVHLLEHSQFVSVEDDGEIKIDELVLSQMFATPPDRRPYLEDWTKVLMPIRGHCDVNLYLGMMTAELQGLPAAIQYFIEGALAAPRGGWCRLYSSVLTQLSESRRLKSLAPAERIDILNALVHCQLGDRAFAEGLKTIRRLNAMASQSGNTWMVGQCLLNRGVAEWESRGVKQAIHFFEKAISFGRSNGDAELTWKSLSNLAAAKIDQGEYDEAIALITESRQERIRDHRKGYSPSLLILRADVEGKRGHHQKALKLYQRAENEAKRSDSFALAASCAINIGNSLASLGRVEEAIQAYQSARTIAEQDELIVIEEQAREAEAYLRLRSGSYEKAATLLQELVEFRQKHKRDIEHIAVALHDRVAAYFQSGMTDVGFLAAKEAIKYCRENGLDHWIARTHHDVSTLLRQQGHHHEAFRYLRTQADVERRNGKRHISCKLQAELVEVLIVTSAGHAELLKEMKKCREWWSEFPKDFEGRCRLGELEFGLIQRSGESVQGVEILKKLVKLASKHEQKRYELRANAELGLQLVHLGLYDEAEPVLCLAKELARAANVPERMSDVASTLGECLRRAGRHREAIIQYELAEQIAEPRRDLTTIISNALNRAMALRQLGRHRAAETTIQKCVDRTRAEKSWKNHVLSLHVQAEHAIEGGDHDAAVATYRAALRVIQRCHLDDEMLDVSVNLAWTLRCIGRLKLARRILDNLFIALPSCMQSVGARIEYSRILEASELHEEAVMSWRIAVKLAESSIDHEAFVRCSIALIQELVDIEKYQEAVHEIERCKKRVVNDSDVADLLLAELLARISLDQDDESEKTMTELSKVASRCGDQESIMLHASLIIGEHAMNIEEFAESLKWLGNALFRSMHCQDEDELPRVLHFMVSVCCILLDELAEDEISEIVFEVEEWLSEADFPDMNGFVLGPLRIAKRIKALGKATVSARHMQRLVQEEVLRE